MTKMRIELWISFGLCCVVGVNSFIVVPEELPSILSIFYSNVPPIKKGTDSRVGIGFRLGPNADFQVQFEIGPQLNTQPIGPNAGTNNTSKKRQTSYLLQQPIEKVNFNATNPSEKWLNTWKLNLNEVGDDSDEPSYKGDPTQDDNNFVQQLRKLYQSANKTGNDA